MSGTHILLTGCHGLLGQRIIQSITADTRVTGIDVDDTALIHGKRFTYSRLDITNRKAALDFCGDVQPDVIINAAAFTDVDACESSRERCWRINAAGAEHLAHCAQKYKAKLIHISTDYIFNGGKELYAESDRAAPLNYYGRAKLAGENAVRTGGGAWAIIRTSTLYDVDRLKGRTDFVSWIIGSLQQGEPVRVVTDQWGNPTLARSLAAAVWRIIALKKSGIFHIAGKDVIDRYTFSRAVAALFDLDENLITPVTTGELGQAARRPLKIGLDVAKAENELNMRMMRVNEGLKAFKTEYVTVHRNN